MEGACISDQDTDEISDATHEEETVCLNIVLQVSAPRLLGLSYMTRYRYVVFVIRVGGVRSTSDDL